MFFKLLQQNQITRQKFRSVFKMLNLKNATLKLSIVYSKSIFLIPRYNRTCFLSKYMLFFQPQLIEDRNYFIKNFQIPSMSRFLNFMIMLKMSLKFIYLYMLQYMYNLVFSQIIKEVLLLFYFIAQCFSSDILTSSEAISINVFICTYILSITLLHPLQCCQTRTWLNTSVVMPYDPKNVSGQSFKSTYIIYTG